MGRPEEGRRCALRGHEIGRRQDTVRRLLDADPMRADTGRTAAADKAVADAEQRLRRLHAAIEAGAEPAKLEELYRSLGLDTNYRSAERLVEVTVQPRVVSERVRGGTCALTTRLAIARRAG